MDLRMINIAVAYGYLSVIPLKVKRICIEVARAVNSIYVRYAERFCKAKIKISLMLNLKSKSLLNCIIWRINNMNRPRRIWVMISFNKCSRFIGFIRNICAIANGHCIIVSHIIVGRARGIRWINCLATGEDQGGKGQVKQGFHNNGFRVPKITKTKPNALAIHP